MKKCPYCAEEIQDEAIVCRFCGRELKGEPFPKAKGVVFAARGDRYLVGMIVDQRGETRQLGIWDASAPGPPVERYALSKKGKEDALQRFQELEQGATIAQNQDPPACPRWMGDAMGYRLGSRSWDPHRLRPAGRVRRPRNKRPRTSVRLPELQHEPVANVNRSEPTLPEG